jgi:ketosteroid isomerase-like protein
MKKIAILFCISVILFGCCRTPGVDTQKESEALLNIENKWGEAAKAKDIDKMLAIYAPDAIIMQPDMPIIVDQQAYRKSLESWFDGLPDPENQKYTIDQIEVSSSGDLAFTRGTMHYKQTTPDGITDYAGKWLTIYKKINGKWIVVVDISNSDNPLPTPVLQKN